MSAHPDSASRSQPQFLSLLLFLFVGSGCSALIYEIVWLQLLKLTIGSSSISLGVLLGTFMGGMCLGSLLFSRVVSSRFHPLRVYAVLELGIAVLGVALLHGMPLVDQWYAAMAPSGVNAVLMRAVISGLCLLPPTILMGATLPAIARWLESTPRGISWLGLFYGGNTAGAVVGCLLAGFVFLRLYDVAVATYVAVGINLVVTLLAVVLSGFAGYEVAVPKSASHLEMQQSTGSWTISIGIALSGLTALGAEVIWTRQLSLLLGATVYTFSIILAVFLVGLGVGSSVGAILARSVAKPRLAFGCCQTMLIGGIYWSGWMLAKSLPYWPIDPELNANPWIVFQLDLARSFWAMFVPALFWGASFPLALASVASKGQDPGRIVGGIYAANTLGAIVGALWSSLVAIPRFGSLGAQQALIVLASLSAMIVLVPILFGRGGLTRDFSWSSRLGSGLALLVVGFAGVLAFRTFPETPWKLIAAGRHTATWQGDLQTELLEFREGLNASIAVTESPSGNRSFYVSGKVVASSLPEDMRLQRMLGHLPALLHEAPESVLIVGCGAGVTAGSFLPHPTIARVVICEIEPLIPDMAEQYFGEENYHVVRRARVPETEGGVDVQIVEDDARHYVLTTQETFDIITSDPIHPWVKGAAALYSTEYYELCKKHLNPGGVYTQWVPLYESNLEAVKSQIATFMQVFPNGTIWSNDISGRGYDIVLLGQVGPTVIDIDKLDERLSRPDHISVAFSLAEVGFYQTDDLLVTYCGQGPDLLDWMSDAEINFDHNLRLQYLAGLGLNTYEEDEIYQGLIAYRLFPETLFVGSSGRREGLRRRISLSR